MYSKYCAVILQQILQYNDTIANIAITILYWYN